MTSPELEKLIDQLNYSFRIFSESPDAQIRVVSLENADRVVRKVLEDWFKSKDRELTAIIQDWESRMDDDKSFFSLGVRRAQDVIRGESQVP